ncbi:MAG: hypothetical protein ACR2NL_04330 [Acidimicrobiia bacterium]
MTYKKHITFMEREEQDRCGLCNARASLAKTSEGLLCATCVLLFLRKPPEQTQQADRTAADVLRRDLWAATATVQEP